MRLNTGCILSILLFFLIVPKCLGQDEKKSIELKKILVDIAEKHKIKFSYLEEDIFGHSIFPPPGTMPLKAKLVYITNRTGLNFKQSSNNILIFSGRPSQKKIFCAYLTDEVGQPIENAVIQYRNQQKIVTGTDGYFELPQNMPDTLYIDHLGYQPLKVVTDYNEADCQKIVLILDILMLDEIVTERYLAKGISKLKDGGFSIQPKKFGILPGLIEPDVLLAMQQLPGIGSIDETVSNINVRGGTHDQNLFLWNGIRLFQTGHFFGLISALNPNLGHSIKIYKNGTPALYGDSVSSVVNISSRSDEIGETSASVGSNMISADAYTNIKLSESTGIELSARRSFTDVLDFPTYNKYSQRIFQNTVVTQLNNSTDVNYKSDKEFYFYDFTGQFHQKFKGGNTLYFNIIGINNNLDFTEGTITETNVVTKVSSLDQQTLGGNIAWNKNWDDNKSIGLSLYGSRYNVDATNASIESNQVTRQHNEIFDAGLNFTFSSPLTRTIKLNSSYQFNTTSINNRDETNLVTASTEISENIDMHALSGEMEYHTDDNNLYTRVGMRFNYITQFDMFYAEPRLQANYLINGNWQIEVLAEQKSQSLSQVVELQNDFLGIEKRRWTLANNIDIPVQKSRQASIGATYKNRGWLITIDNFYKKVNSITTGGQAFQDQHEGLQATGSYTVYGTEFLIQKQFQDFYAWLGYTWNNNRYNFKDFPTSSFPSNFQIAHTINSAVVYEWKKLELALGSRWFSGRPYTAPLSNFPVYGNNGSPAVSYSQPNAFHIGSFMQFNFSANYTLQIAEKYNLQLGLSILNIFNRQNIINRYYRINPETENIERVNTYALERTPNALIKFSF
jgi:hypothetical protein